MSPRKPPRVVFTNGCFDILHVGHSRYLRDARALGELLVVGINSDASVRRLKGPERPIQTESDRGELLAALAAVDYVVVFDEETPAELIERVEPDILVKGGDWPVEKIVGSKFVLARGGEVKSLPFHPGHSTTSLIERIDKR
ncbi:MAG: D-glycero-beta-D-manno-heptose 1-phosphate adenylyltransferase [Bdellovibrionales bacterium]|nr:D-glycero-beta-D-manno-heptose 1-phosphate adenylyltransferase [Bdellovibrionales bacterium]